VNISKKGVLGIGLWCRFDMCSDGNRITYLGGISDRVSNSLRGSGYGVCESGDGSSKSVA